jgi:glycosyltransferase involved in cell wall biosynthesis
MIHIFYRHTNNLTIQDYRPNWFTYENAFLNLLDSFEKDKDQVLLNVLIDGRIEDNFVNKYFNQINFIQVEGGDQRSSWKNTNIVIKEFCDNNTIKDNDIIYILENDYIHVEGWVGKLVSFFEKKSDSYVSLYDHPDKYSDYTDLKSRVISEAGHHWRTAPSTCGSYVVSKKVFLEDYDISPTIESFCYDMYHTPDHFKWLILNLYKKREIFTPIPSLATHSMSYYLAPNIDWESQVKMKKEKLKICLYDHHNYPIPTIGCGGVTGMFQMLYDVIQNYDVKLTLIVNDQSTVQNTEKMNVIKLPFTEIENLRYGRSKISDYFNDGIFFTNSSGRHVNFDFTNFRGKWVAVCQGCHEYVGNADLQVFVSQNQMYQHFRDNLLDSKNMDYKIVYNAIDKKEYYWEDGSHDRIVWIGRIDGAKAERLYEIALRSPEKILAAGWFTEDWRWLFDKIMSTGNVEWIGKIEGLENKREFFSKAKLNIHCSTFEDPCPLTVLEAQACGIPVLSYANGSMKEICYLKDLVCSSLEEFIEKINIDHYTENKNNIIDYISNNFSSESYGKRWYQVFRELNSNL